MRPDEPRDFYSLLAAMTRSPEIPEAEDVYGCCAAAGIWTFFAIAV